MERNGLSQEGLEALYEENRINETQIREMLTERDREIQLQAQYERIAVSRYNNRFKYIRYTQRPEYLVKKGSKASQCILARVRCGNLEEYNRYWLKEEDRVCKLCERGPGTLKHLLEECEEVERIGYSLEQVVEGRTNEKVVKWLREVEGRKEKRERERRQ